MSAAPRHFGPLFEAEGVRFELWAPSANGVRLLLDNRPPAPMRQDAEGYWTARAAARPGELYRFEVDGRPVPDPASRFQPLDVDGPSQLVDLGALAWTHADWIGRPWEETVLYEAHVGLLGGFDGLRRRLPGLKALGITAVELMPIGDFAGARNWGYDGVLPFAPDSAYGQPDALRALIDEAHGLGLMVFLDVVYNHFGPHGNWLPAYAPEFFDPACKTPWGAGIDFRKPPVRQFFIENALHWLEDWRFDGLRLDAVHAIADRSWLVELAKIVRERLAGRHVHLVLENEGNEASLLEQGYDAQWNDDFHHALHVLLTGERHAYYRDFADAPADLLARCLAEGFAYQGDARPSRPGRRRGEASGHLPPTAFVNFLQNHDQIGNRAFGERLTALADPRGLKAATALLLLCPQIPMLFMGEEHGARAPFLFFTDFHGDLAAAVREGRRDEFAGSPGFADPDAVGRIPDPNAPETFQASRPGGGGAPDAAAWRDLVQALLALRRGQIAPRLRGAVAEGARALSGTSVLAAWRLGDGARLTLASNLGPEPVADAETPDCDPLYGPPGPGLPAYSTTAWIEP